MRATIDNAEEILEALRDSVNVEELYNVLYDHFFGVTVEHDTLSKEDFVSIAFSMVNY